MNDNENKTDNKSIIDPSYNGLMIIENYFMKRKSEHAFIKGWVKRYFIIDLSKCTLSYKSNVASHSMKFALPLQNLIKFCPTYGIRSPSGWPYGLEIFWVYKSFMLFSNDVGIYTSWMKALIAITTIADKPITLNEMLALQTGAPINQILYEKEQERKNKHTQLNKEEIKDEGLDKDVEEKPVKSIKFRKDTVKNNAIEEKHTEEKIEKTKENTNNEETTKNNAQMQITEETKDTRQNDKPIKEETMNKLTILVQKELQNEKKEEETKNTHNNIEKDNQEEQTNTKENKQQNEKQNEKTTSQITSNQKYTSKVNEKALLIDYLKNTTANKINGKEEEAKKQTNDSNSPNKETKKTTLTIKPNDPSKKGKEIKISYSLYNNTNSNIPPPTVTQIKKKDEQSPIKQKFTQIITKKPEGGKLIKVYTLHKPPSTIVSAFDNIFSETPRRSRGEEDVAHVPAQFPLEEDTSNHKEPHDWFEASKEKKEQVPLKKINKKVVSMTMDCKDEWDSDDNINVKLGNNQLAPEPKCEGPNENNENVWD